MATKKHNFNPSYNNNGGYFSEESINIRGVNFHDVSWFLSYDGRAHVGQIYGTLMPTLGAQNIAPSATALQSALRQYENKSTNIDHMNKTLSMMYINWNGAEIEHGDFATGNNYVVSTTPEFLNVFNSITSVLFNNVGKYLLVNNRIKRQKAKVLDISSNTTLSRIGYSLNDYEILNIIYNNTSSHEVLISIPQNSQVGDISGATFKTPDGIGLYVMIQPRGYGEISFLRRNDKVYVRGL